jgi:L-2,4-diaminobutyrate decarboxylase
MGPLPSAVERVMVEKLGGYLGWKGTNFDAILTHGGSAANLTALLAARNFHCPGSWKEGLSRDEPRPAFLTSAESHYSIARAAGIIGLGSHQVIKVPCDERHKLDERQLGPAVREAESRGLRVIGVVGSACSTSTGSFDRLRPIGEFCRERGLWFHADLAHGGGLLLSRKHRRLLDGVELADSVTWDAHKMMFVPALCTFLFYRDKQRSFEAFDQDAPYLFSKEANPTLDYDSAVRTLECTKRPIAMALWALWSVYGEQGIASLVDRCVDLGREFHELLEAAPDFEPLHRPECNILCFRYLPAGTHQSELRAKLVRAGKFYITATRLNGVAALRVTLSNPLTTREHLQSLMKEIREIT